MPDIHRRATLLVTAVDELSGTHRLQTWRSRHARGEVIIVRWADDFVVGFQHQGDARQFLRDLRERFAKFSLELHADKTRLLEFGRFAATDRAQRGLGKPETFDFLGFTHISGKGRSGSFWVRRTTIKKRMRAKLAQVKDQLKRAGIYPSPSRADGWPAWYEAISLTTPCQATSRRS